MKKWISTAVIYQINLRSLAAREPRNAIEAVKEKPLSVSPLAYTTQMAPTFSLRGGTREILRGMIARGMGLR